MYWFAVIFELTAYGFFLSALFGSTCIYLDAKRGGIWERYDIAKLFVDLKILVIGGTICHILASMIAL